MGFDGGPALLLVYGPNEAIFRNLYIAQEAVADCGYGGDIAGIEGVVSEEAAQQGDAAGQGVLGYGSFIPDCIEQLVLCNDFMRVV
jgi:hypothetical protein